MMDAQPLPASEPKLKVDKLTDGQVTCLRLTGTIDEHFEGKRLAQSIKAERLILDLGGVRKISSFGIREWVDFVATTGERIADVYWVECSPKVVDQLNMVANLAGRGHIFSLYAPYRCDYCDADRRVLLQMDRDAEAIRTQKPPERPCQTCGGNEYFDEDAATFLSYVSQQPPFELPPAVAAFLSAKLSYDVSASARRFRAEKQVAGRWTHLRLSGDLDGSFPRDKIAEGLEGALVIDVSAVGKIDPAGAAGWRSFLQAVSSACERVCLTGCPPVFLERLSRSEDLGKAQIVSFSMPYGCERCGTTTSHAIDVARNFDVLKFATPPETACPDCGGRAVCTASEALLAHLAALPRPETTPELLQLIAAVREVHRTETPPAPDRKGTPLLWMGVAAAAFLVAGVLGVLWLRRQPGAARIDAPKLVRASAAARPDWAPKDARAFSACTEAQCVAVSPFADSEAEAQKQALDAAVEQLGHNVALRHAKSQVEAFAPHRQRLLDSASAEARDRRRRVAEALRRTGAAPQPSAVYVEEYEGGKTMAYVRLDLGERALAALGERYQTDGTVLGASAATAYPGLAWRWPEVTAGAFLDSVGPGALRDAGLSPRDVVLEVAGKRIETGEALATEMTAELQRARKDGGALKLRVQSGDGEPRELSVPVAREARGDKTAPPPAPPPVGTGVNVWDRTGGGAVRDDPND